MKRMILLALLWSSLAHAQLIFRSDFQPLPVQPLFPQDNGVYQLPNEPAANQLQWIIDQLATNDTSIADINQHFSAGWLSQISASQTRDFIQSVRDTYPSAEITDLVALTAMHAFVFIEGTNNNTGTILLEVSYSGNQLITAFGVNGHNGNLQYPEDMNLTLDQAITKFSTLASDTGVLIAYINDDNQCQEITS